jgi:hypothetical protein
MFSYIPSFSRFWQWHGCLRFSVNFKPCRREIPDLHSPLAHIMAYLSLGHFYYHLHHLHIFLALILITSFLKIEWVMSRPAAPIYNALIRTHHITSRKKVASLKKAAEKYACYALLRSGGSPGIMYCEGSEVGVRDWVTTVQVS